jgi:hypothetical protein
MPTHYYCVLSTPSCLWPLVRAMRSHRDRHQMVQAPPASRHSYAPRLHNYDTYYMNSLDRESIIC